MLTKKRYSFKELIRWSRMEIFIFLAYSGLITVLYEGFGLHFLHLPWTPIALIGTAVAFILSFQNNAAYGRIWEARKIWGGIVNYSRTWGMMIQDTVQNSSDQSNLSPSELKAEHKTLIHRHIAWLTALRYAMREERKWEVFEEHSTNKEWSDRIFIPERRIPLEEKINPYLSQEDLSYILTKKNKPAALLYLQSRHIRRLKEQGTLWAFSFLKLEEILEELFNLQGKSERIKNFPYPRQYATLSYAFVWIFILLIPFGLVSEFELIGNSIRQEFDLLGQYFIWLAIPFCAIVSWTFHIMKRIGIVGENPFEGSANDVPISTISRGIEIDLRQLLDEDEDQIPEQFPEKHNVQM